MVFLSHSGMWKRSYVDRTLAYINQLLNRKTSHQPHSSWNLRAVNTFSWLFWCPAWEDIPFFCFQQILKASPCSVTVLVSFKTTLNLKLVRAWSLWFQEFNVNELRNISNLLFGVQSSSKKHICRCRDLGCFFSFSFFFFFSFSFLIFIFFKTSPEN